MFNHMFTSTIALVLPIAILHVSNANGISTRVCNNPNVTVIGNEYFNGFYEAVKYGLNETRDDDRYLFRRIIGPMFQYVTVANESCYHDTFSRERDGVEYHKFMKFSLTHGFREFIEDGGVRCITSVKDKINECVKDIVGVEEGSRDKFHTLWKATGLEIGYQRKTCKQVAQLKNCTQSVIRNEGYYKCPYDPNIAVYVGSLFEYMLERCKRLKSIGFDDAFESKFSDHGTNTSTNILLGVLILLMIILIIFVMVRYCRAADKPWKFNELFTLRHRRDRSQSQLQNEVGQEN